MNDLRLPATLDLQDAELARITAGPEGALLLRLAAAPVQLPPEPGQRHGPVGHALGVVLRLDGATVLQQVPPLLGRIRQATCRVLDPPPGQADGQVQRQLNGQVQRWLPLPGSLAGPLLLHLALAQGGALQVQAQALHLAFDGPPRWQESLAC